MIEGGNLVRAPLDSSPLGEPMRRTRIVLVFAAAALALSCSASEFTYDEAADPHVQLDGALAESRQTAKPVLVQMGGNWCPDARRLDAFYRSHSGLWRDMQDDFVVVRINHPREGRDPTFFDRLPSYGWVPTLIVMDADAQVLGVAEGTAFDSNDGYREASLRAFLEEARPGR